MFKQFLKNWDEIFHGELGNIHDIDHYERQSSSSNTSLMSLEDITMLRKTRREPSHRSQSYIDIENDFLDLKTEINTLRSSLNPFTYLRRKKTFRHRIGKDWKMQSQLERPKTSTKKFVAFKYLVMTKFNAQNVWWRSFFWFQSGWSLINYSSSRPSFLLKLVKLTLFYHC